MGNHLDECPHCGGGLRFIESRQQRTNGHHLSVYECGECGREVIGG